MRVKEMRGKRKEKIEKHKTKLSNIKVHLIKHIALR